MQAVQDMLTGVHGPAAVHGSAAVQANMAKNDSNV